MFTARHYGSTRGDTPLMPMREHPSGATYRGLREALITDGTSEVVSCPPRSRVVATASRAGVRITRA
ncbi:MAG TPA: hypothetical protein VGH53_24140 [Streptosporangiaceae bacterium]